MFVVFVEYIICAQVAFDLIIVEVKGVTESKVGERVPGSIFTSDVADPSGTLCLRRQQVNGAEFFDLALAHNGFGVRKVVTFTFKGHAEYVLFPEIENCVNRPWKC